MGERSPRRRQWVREQAGGAVLDWVFGWLERGRGSGGGGGGVLGAVRGRLGAVLGAALGAVPRGRRETWGVFDFPRLKRFSE